MKVVNFFGKFFAIIFTIIFAILVLFAMLIGIFKFMLQEENVSNYLTEAQIFDRSTSEVLGKDIPGSLRSQISIKLKDINIPEDVTNGVLDSKQLNTMFTDYLINYVDYILLREEKPNIVAEDLVFMIENEYAQKYGNLTIEQKEKLTEYVRNVTEKINNSTPDIIELEEIGVNLSALRPFINIAFVPHIMYIFGFLSLILYVIVAICLFSKLRSLRWFSKALIVDGILLFIGSFMEVKIFSMLVNNKGIIDNLAITLANKSFENLLIYGIALMVIGIILLIICAIIMKKEKKEESDDLLNDVIKEEVEESSKHNLNDYIVKNEEAIEKSDNKIREKEKELNALLNDLDDSEVDKDKEEKTQDKSSEDENNEKEETNEDSNQIEDEIDKALEEKSEQEEKTDEQDKEEQDKKSNSEEKKEPDEDSEQTEDEKDKTLEDENNEKEDEHKEEKSEEDEEKDQIEDKKDKALEETKPAIIDDVKIIDEEPEKTSKEKYNDKKESYETENEYEEIEDNDSDTIVKKDISASKVEEVQLDVVPIEKKKDIEIKKFDDTEENNKKDTNDKKEKPHKEKENNIVNQSVETLDDEEEIEIL